MHRGFQNSSNKRSRWDHPTENRSQPHFYPPLPNYQANYQPVPPPPPPTSQLPVYQPCDVFSLRDSGPLLKTPEQIAFVGKIFASGSLI